MALRRTVLIALALFSTSALAIPTPAQFAEIEKTTHIAEGAALSRNAPKRTLYVFFDPNCWYCNLTWRALQPYQKAGLRVHWIPVAFQKPSSTGRAAAIMEARDPVAALRENETKYRATSYDGGITPLAKARPETLKALAANLALMQKIGAPGTPAVVWKDAKGNIGFKNAMLRLSELPAITGLPAQKIDDPRLEDFR